MAHVWVRGKGEWLIARLAGDGFALTHDPARPVRTRAAASGADGQDVAALIRRPGRDGKGSWVLLALHDGLRVNGYPLPVGMRVLRDRDSLHIDGVGHLFFSSEDLAIVEPYSGAAGLRCARCKRLIDQGDPAVHCPNSNCGLWYHQMPEKDLPCWTYAPKCARCPQPTDLSTGYRWTPEEL
jgi:hypothetical protein